MKTLDKYLVKEWLSPFLVGMSIFPVMLIVDTAFSLQDIFINKKPPMAIVLKLLVLKLPAILVLAFPVATLLGTLLSLGRLAKDGETNAMRMSFISFYRIMIPYFILGVVLSYVAFLTNEKVVPYSNHLSQNILRRLIISQSLPIIQTNVVFKGGPNHYFYVRRYNPANSALEDVAVYEITSSGFPRTITAQKGYWKKLVWNLEDGVVHNFNDDGFLNYEAKFKRMKIKINFDVMNFFTEQKTPQEMTSTELKKQIDTFKKGGIDVKSMATDYYFKFSIPVACLIFILIGSPLSLVASKSGAYIGIVICVALIFCYYVLMTLCRSLGFNGMLSPMLAAWLQNIVFAIVGIFLIYKVEH